mgnify:CR=1 FL=1
MDIDQLKEKQGELESNITDRRLEIRTDRLDMSFGEIMNMYEDEEIVIDPEFQRAFRWNENKQTRFIESLILEIPFPPIFVAEDKENIWELVDGLQRISTVLSFFGKLKDQSKNNLKLKKGSIIEELEGFTVETMPTKYKTMIKRAVCRVEVIRLDSSFNMRYEAFKRLNTGGEELSKQEIRNCIFRGYDNKFNSFINDLSKYDEFQNVIFISDEEKEKMYYQELVLRYLTLKTEGPNFEDTIQDYMDEFMLKLSTNPEYINYEREKEIFNKVLEIINGLDINAFKLHRNFSTSMYDSIMIGFANNIDYISSLDNEKIINLIEELKDNSDFRENTGSSSSSRHRVSKKIKIANNIFSSRE